MFVQKIDSKKFNIRAQGHENLIVTVILTAKVFGEKLPPMLISKQKKEKMLKNAKTK